MDVNELQEGSTLFPSCVCERRADWTGDSHCLQGNGEVNSRLWNVPTGAIGTSTHRAEGSAH